MKLKLDLPLLRNPQKLIPLKNQFNGFKHGSSRHAIDAIFIPYKRNRVNVSVLLEKLRWFPGKIYLLPSSEADINGINFDLLSNVEVLFVDDSEYITLFNNLHTTKHIHSVPPSLGWDIPLKRNFALYISIKNNFKRILLLDDDIEKITPTHINAGACLLDNFDAAGCFVDDFPDTSVVGHLQLHHEIDLKCFLSGSFLFVLPFEINCFFPSIYNEDWLFMAPLIAGRRLCSFGKIHQKPYDPFATSHIAKFQEFGEIVAEGLFAMIGKHSFNLRYDYSAWAEIIKNRKQELSDLLEKVGLEKYKEIISDSINQNEKIQPSECIEFMYSFDRDVTSWKTFLKESLL